MKLLLGNLASTHKLATVVTGSFHRQINRIKDFYNFEICILQAIQPQIKSHKKSAARIRTTLL